MKKSIDTIRIWTMVEIHQGKADSVSWELIGAARQAIDVDHAESDADDQQDYEVCAVVIGDGVQAIAKDAIAFGADEVMVMDDAAFGMFINEISQRALMKMLKAGKPDIFLIGATTQGRDLASGVSALLETGLTADCTQMKIARPKEGKPRLLMATRPAFSGNLMATIVCENAKPQMSTVRPHVFSHLKRDDERKGKIVSFAHDEKNVDDRVKILEQVFVSDDGAGIEFANVVVAGGRGVGSAEGLAVLHELADEMGGMLGVTRACVDANWASHAVQIGLTGKTVNPALYVACGISGAVQHRVGMQNAHKIIAINIDPDAPIFSVADVGIVGDLFEVVPEMIAQIRAMKAKKAGGGI